MAQIIPRNDLGSALGKSLGTGLGEGLQALADLKLKEFQQRQQRGQSIDRLIKGGVSQQNAELIGSYPVDQQIKLLSRLWEIGPGDQTATSGTQKREGDPSIPTGDGQSDPSIPTADGQGDPNKSLSFLYKTPPRELREQQKLALKERQVVEQEQKGIRPLIQKASEHSRLAQADIAELDNLDKVLASEDIRSPQAQALLGHLGVEDFVPDSKVGYVKKVINQLAMRSLSRLPSGGRPTKAIFDKLEEGLPSLLQTPQGNKIVSDTLKLAATEQDTYFKELRRLQKDGNYPRDVVERATEATSEKMKPLYEKKGRALDKLLGVGKFEAGQLLDKMPKISSIPADKRNSIRLVGDNGQGFVIRNDKWVKE